MPTKPVSAMVLAAGLGVRMRPLTEKMPKPLVSVAGKPLLDHVLDRLAEVNVTTAVVNVHYLPDQIIQHVKGRTVPRVIISDERDVVLGTGGGVVKALPLLGDAPFYHLNSDTMWIDGVQSNLARLAEAFDPARMDILLLMAPTGRRVRLYTNLRGLIVFGSRTRRRTLSRLQRHWRKCIATRWLNLTCGMSRRGGRRSRRSATSTRTASMRRFCWNG